MAVTKRTPKFRTNKIAMAYRDLLLDQAESKYKDAKIQGAYAEKSKLPSTGIIFFNTSTLHSIHLSKISSLLTLTTSKCSFESHCQSTKITIIC